MPFVPLDELKSCVLNAIAYLKGHDQYPEDWMRDVDNLHNQQRVYDSISGLGLTPDYAENYVDIKGAWWMPLILAVIFRGSWRTIDNSEFFWPYGRIGWDMQWW